MNTIHPKFEGLGLGLGLGGRRSMAGIVKNLSLPPSAGGRTLLT